MRLAISNHALKPGGGIERYALTLVRGLHEAGVQPVMIAKAFDRELPEFGWVEPLQVNVRWLPGKLRDAWFDLRIRAIKRHRRLFPLVACNQTGAADIAICGSTHPGYLEAMGETPGRSDELKIATERAHLGRAKIVLAHSRLMASQAQRFYGVPDERIRLLYPPVDAQRFSPVHEGARRARRVALGFPVDRPVFLLASTGHRRKGLDLLLDVFARSSLPAVLAVVGRPVGDAAQRLGHGRLIELGYRTDIEDVYRAADFTVMASRFEPFGLVGVESVLCGTPVLLASNVGCAEVIREPAALLFELDDAASLEAAMQLACQRWAAGDSRLKTPANLLGYDPSVVAHVAALLSMVRELAPDTLPGVVATAR